ncbi:sugar phosphorylase [Anaerobranca gottschalkii]|uniref:Sucrose 6(F)-phosphate phosphorylase n=1 Tax=Anaerobranca gottschalkii DSM 13577 TaxID=1120990 RepID=A0A1I0CBZ6_9FIRM|nr:sugar phosphorylase [Anaerobranca gottschalkii]SET16772.1 sucrose phosphorylase [Anaerobranca gottschalkii DSM 13577]
MKRDELLKKIETKLKKIYGVDYRNNYIEDMKSLIKKWEKKEWAKSCPLTNKNVYLIVYGDSIYENNTKPLNTLHKFLKHYIGDVITDIHILPMFEYTSDDGFSVVDYTKIEERLGSWDDIKLLSKDYNLMFDFVANHISKKSSWFKGFLSEEEKYNNYFIIKKSDFDTSKVIRPRTSALFHEYVGRNGIKTVWTTFSEDQIDLNYKHFPVLLELTEVLLMYANRGASSIRLDAIGFLWKESGTTCMHLPQTHEIIKLWRLLLDYFKPNIQIITETNVPHNENISYFGNGNDEANMVYQFALPPLVLYTFTVHNSQKLTNWAKSICKISDTATYLNFLASHDGIGIRPIEGILEEDEKQILINKVIKNGGQVSYKTNDDGNQSVYELNINYFDALINLEEDKESEIQIKKMLAAHAIILSFIGVPAIYYHSLLGSRNDYIGFKQSGIKRRINREKLEFNRLIKELDSDCLRKGIFNGLKNLIYIRQKNSAFSPYAEQRILDFGDKIFALERENKETRDKVTFIVNVDCKKIEVKSTIKGIDLLTDKKIDGDLMLDSYQFMWIKNA